MFVSPKVSVFIPERARKVNNRRRFAQIFGTRIVLIIALPLSA